MVVWGGKTVTQYTVTITIEGNGQIFLDRSLEHVAESSAKYNANSIIDFYAQAGEGYVFAGWNGDVEEVDSELNLTVSGDTEIVAVFVVKTQEPVTANINLTDVTGENTGIILGFSGNNSLLFLVVAG